MGRDITARKRAEERLLVSEMLSTAILASLHDHVAVISGVGEIIRVNEAWLRFAREAGAPDTARASVGANYLEVCRQAIKAGDRAAENALAGIESVLGGSKSHFTLEYECSSPSQERWFKMIVLPLRRSGGGAVITHSDITDRKRDEEALRRSERRLRLLTDALPVLISYVDSDQRYRFNNKKYEDWFGRPREQVNGKHLREVLGEEAYQAIRPHVEAALSGRRVTFDDFIPYQGVGRRYVRVTYVPDLEDCGTRGFFVLVQDFTERKQAEDEIRASRDELSMIITGADVGTWNWHIQAGTVDVNDRFCTMLGYEPATFGTDVRRFFESLHPDDVQNVNRLVDAHFAGESEFYQCDFRLRTATGAYKWIHDAGRLIERDAEGKPLRMVGIHMDMTDRMQAEEALKRSEEEFRSMFELAAVGSAQADPETGRFKQVNRKFCEITGYSEDELLNMTYRDITYPEDRERDTAEIQKVVKGEADAWSIEKRYTRRDGKIIWVYVNGTAMRVHGRAFRTVANIVDISDRKRAEEELQRAYDEIKKLKERLEAENIYLQDEMKREYEFGDFIGQSNLIKYVLYRIEQVASAKTTVLLTGETGTGKGILARMIHDLSPRKDRSFVHVNCAALPGNLVESELFGREKGAFTGAGTRQIGRFELADGGTIFLDEIGEMPLELQAKLLRVIESGEFERLGSPRTVKVDVRIVASTNRSLEREIREGRFREDLFYRLSVFPITVPPLRQRPEDILLLVKFALEKFSKQFGKRIEEVPVPIMKSLGDYPWPGNVRELMSVVERAVIVSKGPVLQLAEKIDGTRTSPEPTTAAHLEEGKEIRVLSAVEREHILRTLERTAWKIEGKGGASEALGMNPSTLRARMKKLGLMRPKTR